MYNPENPLNPDPNKTVAPNTHTHTHTHTHKLNPTPHTPKNVPRNHRPPPWPALLFTYIEPILLTLGAQTALLTPTRYITAQLPHPSTTLVSQEAILLSYTLGSLFLLLAAFSLLCTVLT
ncbi:hypothetical protein M3J09_006080, partial [Ascochyta lentis]